MRENTFPRAAVGTFLVLGCMFSLGFVTCVVQASPGWAWSILPQFDRKSYTPGSRGTVTLTLTNRGDGRLRITQFGIQFDWQPSDKWWAQSANVLVNVGQQVILGTVTFEVPSNVKGTHTFRVGVVQTHEEVRLNVYTGTYYYYWVDDGLRYADSPDEILVEELKAVLTIVSVTGLPILNRSPFVGETTTTVVVVSNTGNAKAQAVKVMLENLSPSTGLAVTSTDSPKDLDPLATGQWKIDVLGQQPGKYTGMLRVYAGNERVQEQAWKLDVAAPEISIVRRELSAEGAQAYLGDTVTVTYRLRNLSPVDAKSLTYNVETGGSLTVVELPTVTQIGSQSEVIATLKIRAARTGAATVRVAILAYGATVQQDVFSITISERPLWMESWFLPMLAVIALVAVASLVMYRRRGQKPPAVTLGQPKAPPRPSSICPKCGGPLTYVQARSKYYCPRCREYL